ncbi:MAG: hypothetical protein LBJ23_06850, partial [Tannerella sp.]|nr:hypothetical protein [Tannerella sp.]
MKNDFTYMLLRLAAPVFAVLCMCRCLLLPHGGIRWRAFAANTIPTALAGKKPDRFVYGKAHLQTGGAQRHSIIENIMKYLSVLMSF